MGKNLLYVLTYIGALALSIFIIGGVAAANPDMTDDTLELWLQILFGLVGFVLFIGFFFRYMKKQLNDFQKRRTDIIIIGVVGFFLMYLGSIILNIIVMSFGTTEPAGNQSTIESMFVGLSNIELFLLISVIVFFTPVVEELTFRKGLYGFFGKLALAIGKKINPHQDSFPGSKLFTIATVVAIVGSGLLFWFIHVMGSGDYIYIISYGGAGMMLGYIYHYSGRNIYASIIAHILQNSLAVIFMMFI